MIRVHKTSAGGNSRVNGVDYVAAGFVADVICLETLGVRTNFTASSCLSSMEGKEAHPYTLFKTHNCSTFVMSWTQEMSEATQETRRSSSVEESQGGITQEGGTVVKHPVFSLSTTGVHIRGLDR